MKQAIESSQKSEVYYPSKSITENANCKEYDKLYKFSIEHREEFWAKQAEDLAWYKKWDKVLDSSHKPFYKWFTGGKFNIVHNAIDRHLTTARRNKLAIIWEGEPGDHRSYSYHALNRQVSKLASVLKNMGVKKGDIVTIYMPQIPEIVFAMLACAKIGAVHSVVYGGFSVEALAERIEDAKSRVLITADGGWRRGKIVDLKAVSDQAMERCEMIKTCIVVKRTGHNVKMENDRDFWYHDLMESEVADPKCKTEILDSEDRLFVLYTSGTTGKPKGQVHAHAGYALYTSLTHKWVFDVKDEDRYWCAADPGWVTGHSYLVYAPLINGATMFMYEGAPGHPNPNRWWDMIEQYQINILYTSPTAIRGLMRFGDEWPSKHDLSSLRLLGSVGEPINPEAWKWYYKVIGREKCPIMDTWWQTETGGFVITPLPITPLKPGSCTKPFFGQEVAVVNEKGEEVKRGEEGTLVLKAPWPGMTRTLLNDDARFVETYFKQYEKQGWYKAGDSARIDEDGYVWVIGRIDDVIKVSGYRLGTAEVESALVSHQHVAEAAVIGIPHELKGNAIHAFCILNHGVKPSRELESELKEHVSKELGPIGRPEHINFVDSLPKTRSGKIMRRVLKARALGQPEGDLSTLEQ